MFEIILLLIVIAGFTGMYFVMKHMIAGQQQQRVEQLVEQAFGKSAQLVAEQSKLILSSEKQTIKDDLHNKHQTLEKLVEKLQEDIKLRQQEIRILEQDRVKKFSELATTLENHAKQTDQLVLTTKQLSEVLSNNQARGEWGERIIEDLLQANGLVEGVHYARQTTLGSSNLRPDITLLLPNKRFVAVDVKFPYKEIQKMAVAETSKNKQAHIKQFMSDIKTKIDKVASYISPEEKTLDYAILFVPNEMIFSFINQKFPDLVDYALSKRVLLVSPFTFLIVARTVLESYRNFMIGDSLKEVVGYVDEFVLEWDKFKEKFEKYGRSIDTLKKDYSELTGTRFRVMDKKIDKVQSHASGKLLASQTVLEE